MIPNYLDLISIILNQLYEIWSIYILDCVELLYFELFHKRHIIDTVINNMNAAKYFSEIESK